MNLELVEKIAKAVLYEGYLLYPYRPSAMKNRQRWNFGALYPEAFSVASRGTDACVMQTECLVIASQHTTIEVRIRFLHLLAREVSELVENAGSKIDDRSPDDPQSAILNCRSSTLRPVESLEAGGQLFQTWQEAVEREASTNGIRVTDLCARMAHASFMFGATSETEPICDVDGRTVGAIDRRRQAIQGALEVSAVRIEEQLFKITARISNLTAFDTERPNSRDEALMRAFVSTHTILGVRDGEFVSLLDPDDNLREAAAACTNVGTYPVLVGNHGERDLMLSSPIILYDYPHIAPESAGDLFDSTEIDEILMLRILTLTDEEKREMRNVDDRARSILERTEAMPHDQLIRLHGALRGLRPVRRPGENDVR